MTDFLTRPQWSRLFQVDGAAGRPLQTQIRQTISKAIALGRLRPGARLPSSRELADHLGVARNTVVLAFQQLVEEGILAARRRSGYFVLEGGCAPLQPASTTRTDNAGPPFDWSRRIRFAPSRQRNIVKPADWQLYPYPFVYGQFDPEHFPIADWRECARQALSVLDMRGWAPDLIDGDDPELIDQICTRILSRRGIFVPPDEVMITVGAQQALYLVAELLFGSHTVVGMENPGYPDARNIFAIKAGRLELLDSDARTGAAADRMAACDYLYVTPSHQCPTTTVMPLADRRALIELARAADLSIIEDDYESEQGAGNEPLPALKSLDDSGRVIFIGSLSKILAPGLRLGFVVAERSLVRELRSMRRLMVRHPPANNQRTAALFLSVGHYDALVRRSSAVLRERAAIIAQHLPNELPGFKARHGKGGSAFWVEGPNGFDCTVFAKNAAAAGALIEPGDVFFHGDTPARNYFRMGFASIRTNKIAPGLALLGRVARDAA